MSDWSVTQLTFGSAEGRAHAHSYYDIPAIDAAGRRVLAHRLPFAGRHPGPDDAVEVGLVETDRPGAWTPLGQSRAWSWQQGPLAQWVGEGRAVWNDREAGRLVARVHEVASGRTTTLPRPVYAVAPGGAFALSLDMARLNRLRPGYGYATADAAAAMPRAPADDGVWRVPLDGGAPQLVLPLDRAVAWLQGHLPLRQRLAHRLRRYHYWFNHAKIAPGGGRFTVKLRWRRPGGPWSEVQGVSLTASVTGTDLRLLADATSHVIWQTDALLYFWRAPEMALWRDDAPRGRRVAPIGAGAIAANAHLRHLPPAASERPAGYVFDTPYRETVALCHLDADSGAVTPMAEFANHRPARGPFRCDLHPCPSADGRRIVVTSPADGARQVYLVERAG